MRKAKEAALVAELTEAFQEDPEPAPPSLEERRALKLAERAAAYDTEQQRRRHTRDMRDLTQRCSACGSDRLARDSRRLPFTFPVSIATWLGVVKPMGRVKLARCTECQRMAPRDPVQGNLDAWLVGERLEAEGLMAYWLPKSSNDLEPEGCLAALSWGAWEYRRRLAGGDLSDLIGDGSAFSHLLDAVPDPSTLDWSPPVPSIA